MNNTYESHAYAPVITKINQIYCSKCLQLTRTILH